MTNGLPQPVYNILPKQHPLAGCWAKLERAKEQVLNLNEEVASLLNSGVYTIVGQNDFERRRYAFKLVGPPVPLRFAVLAGEIVHHLRSAFDHVTWAFAKKSGISDMERVNFPVCKTEGKFKQAVKEGIIKGVPRHVRPLIEGLQPYKTSDPANSVLQIVHDLDITDKHRLLVVVTHVIVLGRHITVTGNECDDPEFGIELPAPGGYPWAIEEGAEVHWVPYRAASKPELEMEINSSIQIAFEQVGTLKRAPVIPIFHQLCQGVETAVHQFDHLF